MTPRPEILLTVCGNLVAAFSGLGYHRINRRVELPLPIGGGQGPETFNPQSLILPMENQRQTFQSHPRVLVTGAAGFVGSYLCELLLKKSCQVFGVDNLEIGKIENLNQCLKNQNFNFIKKETIGDVNQFGNFNYIFHLSGNSSGNFVDSEKVESTSKVVPDTDISELLNLLKWGHEGNSKFLFLSRNNFLQDKDRSDDSVSRKGFFQNPEKLVIDYVESHGLNARIVRCHNVYGPRMEFHSPDPFQALIAQAVRKKNLIVNGDGKRLVFPTFVTDLVYGLAQAMFSLGTEGKVYNLVALPGIPIAAAAGSVKKHFGEKLKIEFVAQNRPAVVGNETAVENPADGKDKADKLPGWRASTSLDEGLKHTHHYFTGETERGAERKAKKGTERGAGSFQKNESKIRLPKISLPQIRFRRPAAPRSKIKKRRSPKIVLSFLVAALLVFLPLASLAAAGCLGVLQLKQTQQALLSADLPGAKLKAESAQSSLKAARKIFSGYAWGLRIIGQDRLVLRLEKLFTVGEEISAGIVHLNLALEAISALGGMVFQNQPGGIEEYLVEIKGETDLAFQKFSTAQAIVQSEKNLLPVDVPFEKVSELLVMAQQALSVAPEVLGLNGKKTYLILLQNNMELRPTGGFIGSYGLATFDKGKMIDLEINDVYMADGQLKGHVEPPAELKKYLGEAGWYLRDSNWHPDFPVSARRAEWFLEKETGRSVDGVIGLNLFLAQRILSHVGEIELADFQEKVNTQNLFERAEYHSEVNFFPGSTQKSDFLSSLTRALFEKLKTADQTVWLAAAEAVWQSLYEKDLLLSMNEPAVSALVSQNGWDGRLGQIACAPGIGAVCYLDYLMIVEANVGVNKANFFVQRKISHETKIEIDGRVGKVLRIHYQNQSPSENFPAGRYKNYLRLLVPLEAKLEKVFIDGQLVPESDVEVQEASERQSFGFLVEVPIRSEKVVEVRYFLAEKIDLESDNQYLLFWQKQSGIRDEETEFLFSAPPGISLFQPKPSAKLSQLFDERTGESAMSLLFTPALTRDLVFEIGVVK